MTALETYANLKPAEVWRHFAALNEIPRPSGGEAAAVDYVRQAAAAAGAATATDAFGNIVVRVGSTPDCPGNPADERPIAIQAHLDMVCQKLPDSPHDFQRDAIVPQRHGDIVSATGTTLGADNGIGAAMALATLTTPGLRHRALELLFTTEEETGLFGAAALDTSLLLAHDLINLDSEDPEELTVGCAGGAGVTFHLEAVREPVSTGWALREISVTGLKGGHSGVQIHEPLANAIVLLAQILKAIQDGGASFVVVEIDGGSAHNAIPRDARAKIALSPDSLQTFDELFAGQSSALRASWSAAEPNIAIEAQASAAGAATPEGFTVETSGQIVALLSSLPHGVVTMSSAFPGKVETSCNLAIVTTHPHEIEVHVSSRSFVAAELDRQQARVASIGANLGAVVEIREAYPGWEPNPDSPLLARAQAAYEKIYGKAPSVQVVHAGLECGVIVAKNPALDAISFGPLIRFAHSPDECVYASTVADSWALLCELIAPAA